MPDVEFSVSDTTREKRTGEVHGVNYWYRELHVFMQKISNGEFIEYEEVYPGKFYGTAYSEIERIKKNNHHVLLDVDPMGAIAIKKKYPNAKIIFIKPKSFEILKFRLENRKDTPADAIQVRLEKAPRELALCEKMIEEKVFDDVMVNDDLETAKQEIQSLVTKYLEIGRTG